MATILSSSRTVESVSCLKCLGTGTRLRDVDGIQRGQLCICARRAGRRARLSIVPPVFNSPRLYRLRPDLDRHPNQAKAIKLAQDNPEDSFLFVGKTKRGKSHIAWALYRHAVFQGRPTVACLLRELLEDFRRVELGPREGEILKTPRIASGDLRVRGKKYFLLLQEFEKARPTEFASEMLFDLLDVARDFQHQIVVTSNFTPRQLRDHWGRLDPAWGNSIMTRLQGCHEINFF